MVSGEQAVTCTSWCQAASACAGMHRPPFTHPGWRRCMQVAPAAATWELLVVWSAKVAGFESSWGRAGAGQ